MLQILGNYGRVRHYKGLDSTSKKPMFEYHRQSPEHIQKTIERNSNLDLIGQGNINLKLNKNSSFLEIVAPPIGLEPMTDWLTASRSTGLSYGGSNSNCNSFQFYSAI